MEPNELQPGAYNSAKVLQAEAAEIAAQCVARGAEPDLRLSGSLAPIIPDRFGVAFSGGGIRSACIGLGILQGLARARILSQVHYLSGISGGGYIVGWLTAWIKREQSLQVVEDRLAYNTADGRPPRVATPPGYARHVEPFPLHYLRRYTSYLAPRSGLFSGDTLAMVSIYLRNLLLNQVMLACVATALMLLLQFPAFYNSVAGCGGILLPDRFFWVALLVFIAAYLPGMWLVSQSLHRLACKDEVEWYFAADTVIACAVTACTALWLLMPRWYLRPGHFRLMGGILLAMAGLSALFTWYYDLRDHASSVEQSSIKRVGMYLVAWSVVGLCALAPYIGIHHWLVYGRQVHMPHSYAVFGLPVILCGASLLSYLWVGIAGDSLADAKREWLARAAGYFLAFSLVFGVVFAIAFYGPLWMHLLFTGFKNASWKKYLLTLVLPGGWIFTVVTGLMGARSAKSDGKSSGADISSAVLEKIILVAPTVFLLGVLLVMSWGTHALVRRATSDCVAGANCTYQYLPWADWKPEQNTPARLVWTATGPAKEGIGPGRSNRVEGTGWFTKLPAEGKYWLLFSIFLMVAAALSTRLDVNEFSLHLFYRNRLVRAFVGASRPESEQIAGQAAGEDPRKPSPFTGFAAEDDIFLKTLTAAEGFQGPYPIWGTCLNLTTGEDLAWQQRKGASFIFSPLFCGWDYVDRFSIPKEPERPRCDLDANREGRTHSKLSGFGYRSTRPRGNGPKDPGYIPGYGGYGGAPLIGTAMAASGAAVSPNSGYHSQPGVAALLALFNLRLGWWSGNPRHGKSWKEYAPPIGYLASELFGKSNDGDRYVYLSDGGHFENLGLYELVRRRVRFILCSDADADPNFAFGDLGNAIDHCRRDFGVEIKIGAQHAIKAAEQEGFRGAHYAIGEIFYPGQLQPGVLLYIKSSLTNDEPSDVLGMKAGDKNFPHDPTLDQFFNESMFESYRALGQHMMDYLVQSSGAEEAAKQKPRGTPAGNRVRALFGWAKEQIRKQNAAVAPAGPNGPAA